MARPYLGNPKYTIEVLQKYGFVFQKRFGQNFLIDTHVLERIIEASEITKDDFVLEIGPGIGTMTQYLAEAAREVTAVEIDDALIPILKDTLKEWDNVTVLHGDILKTDIRKIADEKNQGRPIKVVANVPPNCFMPRPKVGSAVIRLTRHQNPPVTTLDEKLMFRLIRASFNQRRKTLSNSLKNSQELPYSKEEVEAAITECGLPLNIRGEALTLEQFARLSDTFSKLNK